MKYILKYFKLRSLYNFFLVLALFNIFFSTGNVYAKTFTINDIEISTPFEINFDKNKIIDKGFVLAFNQLISSTVKSPDQEVVKSTTLEQIKGMIETFSIKEEKFINDFYYLNLSVSFNKKNLFSLLEKKNIFPSLPIKKNIIFIPIFVNENKYEIQMFAENNLYRAWNSKQNRFELLNYILPTEDLEDFNLIKNNIKNLENFDFKQIVYKYNIQDYIIAIFYTNTDQVKLLNKISLNKKKTIRNIKFSNIDFNNKKEIDNFIYNLKKVYEDFWKSQNEINTSVKLVLKISIENINNIKVNQFEEKLSNIDLVYNFFIYKFNNKNNFYKIIFNGSPDKFLDIMKINDYEFETKNKIWVLK